jgi:hypothetical protein
VVLPGDKLGGGANNTSLTNNSLTLTNVQASNTGPYFVVVTNTYGVVTSDLAVLTVRVPPSIVQPPADQLRAVGETVRFSVVASGTDPLTYRWRFNSNNLAGATNVSLTLTNVQLTNAGSYQVVVTNLVGGVTSVVATLVVNLPVAPHLENVLLPLGVNGLVLIGFDGQAGQSYSVLFRDELENGVWQVLTNLGPLQVNQAVTAADDSAAGKPQRFYRVVSPRRP